MKMTIGQLRKVIAEVVASRPVRMGGMYANIAGDSRYTDTINIEYLPDTDTVRVTVDVSSAAGGMDGPGGAFTTLDFDEQAPAEPKAAMALLKSALSDDNYNFRRYGKPTKRFRWSGGAPDGLSMSSLTAALQWAKGGA